MDQEDLLKQIDDDLQDNMKDQENQITTKTIRK